MVPEAAPSFQERPARDVDYLVLGDHAPGPAEELMRQIAARPDPAGAGATELAVHAVEEIWAETAFPGLRVSVQQINLISGGGFRQTPFNLILEARR